MEAIIYVERNQHGSMVILETNIHVEAVGFAHEGGMAEQDLLEQFHLSKEQLYGALAYFYRHHDTILAKENEAADLARKLSQKGTTKLNEWRKSQSK